MTLRSCRYNGSGAVMISELVAGSAWMKPPVEGLADAATGVDAGVDPAAPSATRAGCTEAVPATPPAAPDAPEAKAARSTAASFTASAFFRYTTQMLPAALLALGGLVELGDDRTCNRQFRRVGRAQDQRIAARIDQDRQRAAAGRRQPRLRRRSAAAIGQALHHRRQVARDRVFQRHHVGVAARRLVERGNDLGDALQVVGVVGDDQ